MIDTDRVTGAVKELGGKVQSEVGELSGSTRDAVEGLVSQKAARAERDYGQAKVRLRKGADDVADYAEEGYRTGKRYLKEGHEQSVKWPHTSLLV
ncbi:CsbD family protein, partial [Methylobacterium sp. C25]|uniref:CsbD family protein n=1 Tax=Methylobacterium sp. C25 TaxID=2721622 RepID=UPI001F2BB7A7